MCVDHRYEVGRGFEDFAEAPQLCDRLCFLGDVDNRTDPPGDVSVADDRARLHGNPADLTVGAPDAEPRPVRRLRLVRSGPLLAHALLVVLVHQPRSVERVLGRRVTGDVDEPRVDVDPPAFGVGLEDAGRHRLGELTKPRLTRRELLRRRGQSSPAAKVNQQQ